MRYILTVDANGTNEREYIIHTASAYKAAAEYGRCEGGEVLRVYTIGGKLISEARYNAECGYIRCTV